MQNPINPTAINHRMIADAFWRMTCSAFCTGLAVSMVAVVTVLAIAAIGR